MVVEKISFSDQLPSCGSIVVGVYSDGSLSLTGTQIDGMLSNEISKTISKLDFKGKNGSSYSFLSCNDSYKHIILVGLGDINEVFSPLKLEKLGATIYKASYKLDTKFVVCIDEKDLHLSDDSTVSYIGFGLLLKSWKFDKYKTDSEKSIQLKEVELFSNNSDKAQQCFAKLNNIATGVFLTRTVVSEPSNVIYPESLAQIAKDELQPLGVKVEILDKDTMKQLGMNSLLAVSQGSANEPKLAVLSWNGGDKDEKPIAFIGKGVTFDSGGISLKPGDGMNEMCHDMAGSGTVLGLLKAIALNKLPVNVIGIMAMVENMPSGTAQRPGDIVTSMSGQTIEVLNTDAEGRMVLADAMWYTQDRFFPKAMVDLATLTGAIVVSLGHEFAGLFSNNDELAQKIICSASDTGEKVWRMPLSEHFDKGINSDVADMQNIGRANVRGGSITAAQFLKRFTNNVDWAHIDIAGVEAVSDENLFICTKGATGFGVHLLYNMLEKNYVS